MLKHSAQLLSLIVITSSLIACGGSSQSADEPIPTPPPAKAALSVDITGLPDNSQGSIKLTGPDGFSQTITSTTTLQDLIPGTYNLSADVINVDGLNYTVLPAMQSVTINENQTGNQSLIYMTDVTSVGVISNFGSVYVNGVRYSTDDVEIETDDSQNASEDDLDLGMLVTVQGRTTADGAINLATGIEYRVNAKGPVSMVSLTNQQVLVFNQVFNVDDGTLFINTSLEQLLIDDLVEISAIPDANGQWLATRIEKEDNVSEFRLRGPISNLDSTSQIFSIVDTIIDYSSATMQGTLVDGAEARISSTVGLVDNVLVASDVYIESENTSDDNKQIALDGVIQSINTSEFVVQGQTVIWENSTEFKGGASSDLAVNVRVKVHGTLSDGLLLARQIRLDKPGIIKVEGAIESINLGNNQILLLGMLFTLDAYSQLKDDSSDDIRLFSLDMLAIGDLVEIKAFASDDSLIVKKLEREAKDSEVNDDDRFDTKLEGQVSEINQPDLQLLGSNVVTSSLTKFEIAELEVDMQTFFDVLSVGDWVEVKGKLQLDGTVAAVKVETGSQGDGNGDDNGVEFTGIIDEFTSINQFKVNGRAIITNEFTVFTNGFPSQLALMQRVEIHGREAEDGSILATRLHFEDNDDENEVELKGTLTNDAQNGFFNINTLQVFFDDSTVFEGGSSNELLLGVLVEIKGNVDQNGILIASRIKFEDDSENEVETEGEITEILDMDSFLIGNQKVILQANTEFKFGNSSRLAVGVWVKVEGSFDEQQQLIAREVKFAESASVEIEATIDGILSDNQFSLGEFIVQYDNFTEFEDGAASDLVVGVTVSVKGVINDQGILEAEEIEFDD